MTRYVWTDKKVNRLLELREKQWTLRKIAEDLGVTKNAVDHQIRRLRKRGIKVAKIKPRGDLRGVCNPEWRNSHPKIVERMKRKAKERFRKINKDRELAKKAGSMSRVYENMKVEELKEEYDKVFYPASICDRICIKDNEIVFVEIKKDDSKTLRPKQEKFMELCNQLGIIYKVVYALN